MWDITPGEELRRTEVHARYKGNRQAGIAPTKTEVFLFSNPSRGRKVGYFDGWGADGCYHYTGEGQHGDQEMTRGNSAILGHQERGRALHLFESVARSVVAYVGQFALATDPAWYYRDAPDANGEIRSVIMFRLKPLGTVASLGEQIPLTPTSDDVVQDVEIEKQHTERMVVSPNLEEREAERREAPLVTAYRDHLKAQGHNVTRKKIVPAGEVRPLFTDLHDTTDNVLIEAKGSVTREAVRMAIGQLYDYRRYIKPTPSLAVLLPSRPREDLIELCNLSGASVIWRNGETFDQRTA
ncbi:restriction endonuclease [Streptomyces sparsogenes]|uniref:ScoMcrA-like SRA domain-containing protein n=1 Tax=Streptomyces cuspidosporus TaxID=66882 RepID=A0ABN3H3K9_9ACTN